jgi:multidrug transporter EmrE-like cation transporter
MTNIFFAIVFVLITVSLNTLAQALLKLSSGNNLLNIYLFSGIIVYFLSMFSYLMVLNKLNLSIAYPVVIGLTVAATTAVGAFFLREKVTTIHWVGVGLMISGITTIAIGKH